MLNLFGVIWCYMAKYENVIKKCMLKGHDALHLPLMEGEKAKANVTESQQPLNLGQGVWALTVFFNISAVWNFSRLNVRGKNGSPQSYLLVFPLRNKMTK